MTALEPVPDARAPALSAEPRPRPQNPYWVYLARFSGESERTMRRCLDRLAAELVLLPGDPPPRFGERFPWERLRYPVVTLLRTRLAERWPSPSHVNKHLSALRGVLEECWNLELMTAEDFQRARKVKQVKGTREIAGRSIHGDEFRALLAACLAEPGPLGIRDAALVAVLQSTGMRRAEAAGGLVECYDPAERALKVIGKGNKERTVYIHPDAVPYLDRWLVMVGARRGPIFRPVDRWGNIGDRHMTARTVGHAVNRRRNEAGLPPLSTHDFRRTFIGDFIDAGGDLVQAQQLAGHASATTTARYDRRAGRARRAAVDRLHLPRPEELS